MKSPIDGLLVFDKPKIGLRGRLHILVRNEETGEILRDEWNDNKIVDAGLNLVRDIIAGGNAPVSHVAVGDNSTAPLAAETILKNEVFRSVINKRIPTDKIIEIQNFIPTSSANDFTLREAGIFNASSAGDMLSRVTYADIVKTSAISVTLTWAITLSEA